MLLSYELFNVLWWIIISGLFVVSLIMLKYPYIPGVLFVYIAFITYGLQFGFDQLGPIFWTIQLLFGGAIFLADFVAAHYSLKIHGGSKLALRGSLIGMILGPFMIPVAGFVLGPFIGAVLAEFIFGKKRFKTAVHIGIGSLIGLFGSLIFKASSKQ
jgi:uncharacterized protein YqgC (DUF456 family)